MLKGAAPTSPDLPRPDPDALLAATRKEGRGRLKVFLGMAPGVGKTYEMLSAAARRAAEGLDVVVGVVESHGRKETEALVGPLEVLARKPIEYRGRTLLEFDIDAALERRPGLLLVDEYAHSNAPGSRHPKRWQDVEELLGAGIDVWTTLNVQHLESLVEVIWRITGVRQQETVPDLAFARADAIEVIDITPEELRERLAAGKVYVPETARLASDRFFKVENLTALRELALRRAAQTVDDALVGHMRRTGIEGPWAAGERILVLIGGDPLATALVRAGRRLADMTDARWTVLHVERPNRPVAPLEAGRTAAAFKLAEQLGAAATVSLAADDLPGAVLQYAARNNITQIVIGRARGAGGLLSRQSQNWRALAGRSLAHVLLERASGAALHVVTDAAPGEAEPPRPVQKRPQVKGYVIAAVAVAAANLLAAVIDRTASGANLAMVFLLAVLLTGLSSGFGPAIFAAGLAAVSYNFFFLEPRLSFVIGHATDILTFVVFFVVAMIAGSLAGRMRDQARATSRRAAVVTALLAASRGLSATPTRQAAAEALAEQAAAAVGGTAVVLLSDPQGEIRPVAGAPDVKPLSTGAMAAARWAWEKGEPAGAGTGTMPQVGWSFWPLQGLRSRSGVAGVEAGKIAPGSDEERLLLALLDQGAVGLERAELASASAEAQALRRSDQLRAALLNSISHDLRTPLSTVLGAATTLIDYGEGLKPAVKADLLTSIREEADRLNRYVGDLLDMTRLEGGGLAPRLQPTDVRDVLGAAIERVTKRLGARTLARDFPAQLSTVEADPTLLEQAVVNILENAINYSPDGTAIEVAAYEDRANVVIAIEDEGKGIPGPELERVFDKFRRVEQPSDRGQGIGLGLAISKGFVEAQGGRIAAASPIHGDAATGFRGTRVLISLPKVIATHHMLL